MKICLQVGHQNIQFNSDSALHGSTGAPQEMGTNYKVVCRTAEILRTKGFEVKQTDANANSDPAVTDVDWDMYLAVHCDADSALLSGGFVDTADPIVDMAHVESQRICDAIRSEYFKHSGIVERPERMGKSDGVLLYYMWSTLTAKTPCVLIEMGESVDPHDRVILNDTEIVANALSRGICKAFNVPFDIPVSSVDYKKLYEDEKDKNTNLALTLAKTNEQIVNLQSKIDKVKLVLDEVNKLIQ